MMPKIASAAIDAAPMAAAANTLGTDLYQQLAAKAGNVFFSPYSISSALTMAQRGARGKTADEMAALLHLPTARVDEASDALLGQLSADPNSTGYKLSVANALWLQTGAPFNQDYLKTTHDSYHAGLEQLDFATHADASRVTINAWVAKQTNDKIKDLLPAGSVTPATRLVLTNAVYFKAAWMNPFTKNATTDGDFTLLDGTKAKAPLMHIKEHFNIAQGWNNADVLELPYKGGDLSMLVILPIKTDADALAAVEKSLTADSIKALAGKLANADVVVTLPRWKLTQRYEISKTLQAMGMKLAFGPGADFSGINGRSDLFISAVIHQAFIDVNEEGTEAAAATAIPMAGAAMPTPRQPIVFNADHPFVYAIIHRRTNTILFMGRIADPTK